MTDRRPQSHLVAYPRTGNRLATADRGTGPAWVTGWGFYFRSPNLDRGAKPVC